MIENLLTFVIFAPLAFAAAVALLPGEEKGQIRAVALAAALVSFGLTVWLYLGFDPAPGAPEFQFELRKTWVESMGIGYHVGVDGLAVSLMLLTGFLGPVVVLSSWTSVEHRVKEFMISILVLQTAMYGTFAALDLALFYVFWEAMLIPMYLLIGVWGSQNRIYAAVKFFLYTFAGSVLMLIAILFLYVKSGAGDARTFDYPTLLNLLNPGDGSALLAWETKKWLFLAFALAFAVKVPMFPLHTWLPDAHVEAPAAGSIILAGVLLKMGVFGFLRYAMPFFPDAAAYFRPTFAILAVVGIVYGSLMSFTQRDMKKLVAYSSVAHLGFVMLGVFALTAEGTTGAIYQMINHGVSTGALFLLIGILYERTHTRAIADYGGIAKVVPLYAVALLVITLSSIGLPGTNGFVGEFLILIGSFSAPVLAGQPPVGAMLTGLNTPLLTAFAASGVVLGAVYMLLMYQRVMFGPLRHEAQRTLPDLSARELSAVVPLALVAVLMGVLPQPFLSRIEPSSARFVTRMTKGPLPVPVLEVGGQPAPAGAKADAPAAEAPKAPAADGPRPLNVPLNNRMLERGKLPSVRQFRALEPSPPPPPAPANAQ